MAKKNIRRNNKLQAGVDLFTANATLRESVSDFMNKTVWGEILKKRCKVQIDSIETDLVGLKKLEGSSIWESTMPIILEKEKEIEDLQKKLHDQLDAEATFTYKDADSTLYNAISSDNAYDGMVEWFMGHGLDVSGSTILADLLEAVGGLRTASGSVILKSDATIFTKARTKNDVLKTFYSRLTEYMLDAGALKAYTIPEDIRDLVTASSKKRSETITENK